MAEHRGSKDKSLEALDFIINVLKEHEQNLDRSIDQLATVTEQIGGTEELSTKLEKAEEKLNNLIKEIANIGGNPPKASKEPLLIAEKRQELQSQTALFVSPSEVQAGHFLILNCKTWEDFQRLATQAQKLTFSYEEVEKVFQANALKGNQMLAYTGAVPNFSSILKIWLSRQFDMSEQNILEGSIG